MYNIIVPYSLLHEDQFCVNEIHYCRYWMLREFYAPQLASCSEPPLPAEAVTRQILEQVGITGWEYGRTKVMLKFNHTAELKRHTNSIMKRIITIQRCEFCYPVTIILINHNTIGRVVGGGGGGGGGGGPS